MFFLFPVDLVCSPSNHKIISYTIYFDPSHTAWGSWAYRCKLPSGDHRGSFFLTKQRGPDNLIQKSRRGQAKRRGSPAPRAPPHARGLPGRPDWAWCEVGHGLGQVWCVMGRATRIRSLQITVCLQFYNTASINQSSTRDPSILFTHACVKQLQNQSTTLSVRQTRLFTIRLFTILSNISFTYIQIYTKRNERRH